MRLDSRIYRQTIRAAVFVTISFILPLINSTAQADWIDVHFHLIADKGDLARFDEAARAAQQIMDTEGIRKIIVMSPPRPRENFDVESLAEVVKKYPTRIAMLGGGGSLNPMLQRAGKSPEVADEIHRRFEETAERILAKGAVGFGEITAHHLSLSPSHAYESVPADHPLLLLLADIAAKHDVPIDLHFDPVPADEDTPYHLSSPRNPPVLKANVAGFERLLAHNRRAKIVWAHAGSDPLGNFTPRLVRELLGRHPNLALSIRPTNPRPGAMVHPKGRIDADWVAVLQDFPQRFVIGSDSMVVATNYTGPNAPRIFAPRAAMQRQGIGRLLSRVSPDLAKRIGYENAERLYRLGP
ncbi:MAG: amidohydrolase [Deltaproteobacteria bacterium]|nr:amidohydrolase [Deltaproteobacteria bacterium]